MDVFAFASRSETQGMVLAEAMTAGVPVVALEAPGASDVITDGHNGRLLGGEDEGEFAAALKELARGGRRRRMARAARATAESFSLESCAGRLLGVYEGLLATKPRPREEEDGAWAQALRLARGEWQLWSSRVRALALAVLDSF
jgi:glycosyltransferase involved in cell wall biosynthesis